MCALVYFEQMKTFCDIYCVQGKVRVFSERTNCDNIARPD